MTRWIGIDTGSAHTALVALDVDPSAIVYVDATTIDVGRWQDRPAPKTFANGRVSVREHIVEPADLDVAADACLDWIWYHGGSEFGAVSLAIEYVRHAYVGENARAAASRTTNLLHTERLAAVIAALSTRVMGCRVERVTAPEARRLVAPGVKADHRGAHLEPALGAYIVGWRGRTFEPTDEERRRDHQRDAAATVVAVLLRELGPAPGEVRTRRHRATGGPRGGVRVSVPRGPCGACKRGAKPSAWHQRDCEHWRSSATGQATAPAYTRRTALAHAAQEAELEAMLARKGAVAG